MKKIVILFIGLFAVISCKDISSYDGNTKAATKVEASTLFANAQKNLADFLTSPNVNLNIYRLLAQHWTETTYIDESNYDLSTRPIPQSVWHFIYRDVLNNFNEAKKIVTAQAVSPYFTATERASQLAVIDVMEVFCFGMLVDTFGDVPYTQALDGDKLQPVYDDAATIYTDLLSRINTAISNIDPAGKNFGSSDLIYGGDGAKWLKFANSVKLRLGMNLADVNPTVAKSAVEQAAPGVFASNSDNAIFYYLDSPPNTNPIWVNLIQSGRHDFVAANTIVDVMNTLSDPRRARYFTTDGGGVNYTGGIYGSNNNFASYSKPAGADQPSSGPGAAICYTSFPGTIMDFSEVSFYLAEAAARGFNVGNTVNVLYTTAIQASMDSWGVDATSASTYLARPAVAYATATGTYKQKIGTQKWLALYNRGYEAWVEWRRLDFPALVAPVDALSVIPNRYTYPVSEQNLNVSNYNAAAAKISGGDKVAAKVFWDIN